MWAESIEDGQKDNFLTLYGLNLLLDSHTVVHLKDNELWTMIKNPPKNHDTLLNMCNFHLVYLGRGLFIELTERRIPLKVLDENTDIKTVVVGELTFDERKTLDKVIYHGLGIGMDRQDMPLHSKYNKWEDPEKVTELRIKKEISSDSEKIEQENKQKQS